MTMTRDQVIDLLSLITAHDNRNPSESDVAMWTEHANRGRWSWPEARDAVISHFHNSNEWLMPSHITAIITGRRQDQASRQLANNRELENQPASHTRVREIVNELSGQLGWVPKTSPALSVPCPHCHASSGYPCVRSGRPGHADVACPPHPTRRQVAEKGVPLARMQPNGGGSDD